MKATLYGVMAASLILLTTCKAQKTNITETSMITFMTAKYDKWVAGIKGGGAGYNVTLELENDTFVELDSIYFKNWKAKLYKNKDNGNYIAVINDGSNNESITPLGTTTNQAETELNSSYQLKDDEAIVSYLDGDTHKYQNIVLSRGEPFSRPRY